MSAPNPWVRLADFNPRWVTFANNSGRANMGALVGMTFDCPHCRKVRLGVFFFDPDGRLDMPDSDMKPTQFIGAPDQRWTRTGVGFDDMTLTPSIDASALGHWHGFITAGNVR